MIHVQEKDVLHHGLEELLEIFCSQLVELRMGNDRLIVEDVQRFLNISLVLLLFLLCELHRCTLKAISVLRLVSEQSPNNLLEYLVHE